jgi:hypothetical protein
MLQLIHSFPDYIRAGDLVYSARAYGELRENDRYAGRLLFFPVGGGRVLVTGVETTQSNLFALTHWSSGLSATYLEGALARAIAAQPEVQLERELARLERAEAEALTEAVELESAANAARHEAEVIDRARAETREQMVEAVANAADRAAKVHDQAAEVARGVTDAARRQRKASGSSSSRKK